MELWVLFLWCVFLPPSVFGGHFINESHCIEKLPNIATHYISDLEWNGVKSNFTFANSVAFSKPAKRVLMAGDFRIEKIYYSWVKAFNEDGDTELWSQTWISPQRPMDIALLRSYTRVIAHPTMDLIFVASNHLLKSFDVTNGDLLWNATIPSCINNTEDWVKYDDAMFFHHDDTQIWVSGVCNNSETVVVDTYDVASGDRVDRNLFSVYDLFPSFAAKLNFGFVPPQTTIAAPPHNVIFNETEEIFYYLGVNHFIFQGIARVNEVNETHNTIEWNANSFLNPAFFTHKAFVTDDSDGFISLYDPNFLTILTGIGTHLTRYELKKNWKHVWAESERYSEFVWYGKHKRKNFHLDWSISIDENDYQHTYVTAAPFLVLLSHDSTLSQHDTLTGQVTGATKLPFYAAESAVTSKGAVFSVGFKFTPKMDNRSLVDLLERTAVFSITNRTAEDATCVGCETNYYGINCDNQCDCQYGYCNDDLHGVGNCYCTFLSYGETCNPCNQSITTCLCNSGPEGDGFCKFCLGIDIMHQSFSWSDKYGQFCSKDTHCNISRGISYPKGEGGDGRCIYCNDTGAWGKFCNRTCDCRSDQYCDNNVWGDGCATYAFGGIKLPYQWVIYGVVAAILFVFFFAITAWKANQQLSKANKSISFFPKRRQKRKKNSFNARIINATTEPDNGFDDIDENAMEDAVWQPSAPQEQQPYSNMNNQFKTNI